MGLLGNLFGKTKQVEPKLDQLFALPSAALTLETQLDLVTSGQAGVCYKASSGSSGLESDDDIRQIIALGDTKGQITFTVDDLGYTWVVINDDDLGDLVTRVHSAHSTLVEHGLGPRLLCSVFGFTPKRPPGDGDVRLVYLAKSGTFYPFAPRGDNKRDNELEIRVRTFLEKEIPLEPDLSRWMALWGVPVA